MLGWPGTGLNVPHCPRQAPAQSVRTTPCTVHEGATPILSQPVQDVWTTTWPQLSSNSTRAPLSTTRCSLTAAGRASPSSSPSALHLVVLLTTPCRFPSTSLHKMLRSPRCLRAVRRLLTAVSVMALACDASAATVATPGYAKTTNSSDAAAAVDLVLGRGGVGEDQCGLWGLWLYDLPWTLYLWVLLVLLLAFPSFGYTEPFVHGLLGKWTEWEGRRFQCADFMETIRSKDTQRGKKLMQYMLKPFEDTEENRARVLLAVRAKHPHLDVVALHEEVNQIMESKGVELTRRQAARHDLHEHHGREPDELLSRYYYKMETFNLCKFKNGLERVKAAILVAVIVLGIQGALSENWDTAVTVLSQVPANASSSILPLPVVSFLSHFSQDLPSARPSAAALSRIPLTSSSRAPRRAVPHSRRLQDAHQQQHRMRPQQAEDVLPADSMEDGGGSEDASDMTVLAVQHARGRWRLLDVLGSSLAVVTLGLLCHFYFVQIACMKQGKLNCHLAEQIAEDEVVSNYARSLKLRADVVHHSTGKLQDSCSFITFGLITFASSLLLKHTLAVSVCRGYDVLTEEDVLPWRNHAGLISGLGIVYTLYGLVVSCSAMWNILVEEMRTDLDVEEPSWIEIFWLHSTSIEQSRDAAAILPTTFGFCHLLHLCILNYLLLMAGEGSGWIWAQLLAWKFTFKQLGRSCCGRNCCESRTARLALWEEHAPLLHPVRELQAAQDLGRQNGLLPMPYRRQGAAIAVNEPQEP